MALTPPEPRVYRLELAPGMPMSFAVIANAIGLSRQRAQQLSREGRLSWRVQGGEVIVERL